MRLPLLRWPSPGCHAHGFGAGSTPTVYGYDEDGSQTSMTDPLGNTTLVGFDAAGNKLWQTDAFGRTANHAYDQAESKNDWHRVATIGNVRCLDWFSTTSARFRRW